MPASLPSPAPAPPGSGSEPGQLIRERVPSPHHSPKIPGALRRFLKRGSSAHGPGEQTYPWWKVLWLTGVDYFSTLGYQPGIAFLAAGALSPLATALVVLVTLAGALPTYAAVARRSHIGQGSIAMLEKMIAGWKGKLAVLLLIGFASTDFVITITLSAADAAKHAVENPLLEPLIGHHAMAVTLVLLALLTAVFLKGFREALGMALLVGVPYVVINGVVIARALVAVGMQPDLLTRFQLDLAARGNWPALLIGAGLIFPKLALGMSGFETGVSVMPLIRGQGIPEGASEEAQVAARVAATRKLLTVAAVLMSVLLIGSSLVTTVLIPAQEFAAGGNANGRALAYLAHELMGRGFGTVYDVLTVLILWFAGASAMAGLLSLIPRYLPRFGMAPGWVSYTRPLILLIFAICLVVTWVFDADVDAQGGAYATGVLVLMLSAAVAVALATWREARAERRLPLKSLYFWLVSAVFVFTLGDNVVERPDGVIIASIFCLLTLAVSAFSRFQRATELRVETLDFADERSRQLWESIKNKKVNLVPLRTDERAACLAKAAELRRYYNTEAPCAFLHVELRDDRSHFSTGLKVRVEHDERDPEGWVRIRITGAVAIANTIAYISEQLDPIALFLGLTLSNKMAQSFKYLLWGEGEIGVLVYEILVRYWESTPEDDVRPLIFLMSE
ncbi:MAG: hypothetical protein HY901_30480 [Deltaproteobacteria bacterium]|nr:hypothetical protein [Deltaproteobacteria bacterium]